MKAGTREWVEKAEDDYHSALREFRARLLPNYNLACYLCQQCIEKYLKGCLQEKGTRIPKTHQLPDLFELGFVVQAGMGTVATESSCAHALRDRLSLSRKKRDQG